MIFNFDQLIQY